MTKVAWAVCALVGASMATVVAAPTATAHVCLLDAICDPNACAMDEPAHVHSNGTATCVSVCQPCVPMAFGGGPRSGIAGFVAALFWAAPR